jgi:hypothetical protein
VGVFGLCSARNTDSRFPVTAAHHARFPAIPINVSQPIRRGHSSAPWPSCSCRASNSHARYGQVLRPWAARAHVCGPIAHWMAARTARSASFATHSPCDGTAARLKRCLIPRWLNDAASAACTAYFQLRSLSFHLGRVADDWSIIPSLGKGNECQIQAHQHQSPCHRHARVVRMAMSLNRSRNRFAQVSSGGKKSAELGEQQSGMH